MADKRFKKIEPKDPDSGLKLLRDGLVEALSNIPTVDNTNLETSIKELTNGLERIEQQLRASQEASKAQSELLASTIASIELNVSESSSEPVDVQPIVEAIANIKIGQQEVPQVDVEGLVEKIFNLTNREAIVPTYHFEIERDHSGLLKGIRAIPTT